MVEKGKKIETEGIITGIVKIEEEVWRIVGIYVNGNMERKLQNMRK